ncbi:hypothetical protein C0V75_19770 [Tabrizicola sp. TH137]|uniref:type II secretion system protein n=1 Tax=Tabrizicola sp. TH137 TaxID=2067452 RepID=UPI000C7D3157|nr:type II secretion system protein [Tabrizicola sp. TH137]PLL10568.1 hypothetical protein C0V75_19770 [Tabrizicola sp. TH137]
MTLPSDQRRRRLGFSLLEAMIAMAILALVLGAALSGVGFTVGRVAERAEAAWATELARSVLDEYAVTRDAGLAEGAVGEWRWSLTVAPAGAGLVEAEAVAWRAGGPAREVRLSVLLPEIAP